MAFFTRSTTNRHHHQLSSRICHYRTFVEARIKWVRDPYLDFAVEKEKNLKQIVSLKNLILSQPSGTLPVLAAATYKTHMNLPTTAANFFQKYPSVFQLFLPSEPLSHLHVKLTHQAFTVHNEESHVLNSPHYREDAARRLAKLLMLAGARKLPLAIIENLRFDLGLPPDFILTLLPEFPEYFQICDMGYRDSNGSQMFGLELVSWRDDLAVSAMEKKALNDEGLGGRTGMPIKFLINLPRGFDLEKKVRIWLHEWQNLPYISPYEDAFFLPPNGDQAEKWTVAVLHELLYLLISKKTEKENVLSLGDYLGFGTRFKKALVHHPGIFYVSNKIRTQTVVLREAYKKDFLLESYILMGMRYRYIHVMNQKVKRKKPFGIEGNRIKKPMGISHRGDGRSV